jgi:hypothetical protein
LVRRHLTPRLMATALVLMMAVVGGLVISTSSVMVAAAAVLEVATRLAAAIEGGAAPPGPSAVPMHRLQELQQQLPPESLKPLVVALVLVGALALALCWSPTRCNTISPSSRFLRLRLRRTLRTALLSFGGLRLPLVAAEARIRCC